MQVPADRPPAAAASYRPPERLTLDPRLQSRDLPPGVLADPDWVDELHALITAGADLGPVEVVEDGPRLWVWDGFARTLAHRRADTGSVRCLIRPGTFADARLLSLSANAAQGQGRNDRDRKKAVRTLLADPELVRQAERQGERSGVLAAVARLCGVSERTAQEVFRAEGFQVHRGRVTPAPKPPDAGTNANGSHNVSPSPPSEGPPDPPPVPADAGRGAWPPVPSPPPPVGGGGPPPAEPPDPEAEFAELVAQTVRHLGRAADRLARLLDDPGGKPLRTLAYDRLRLFIHSPAGWRCDVLAAIVEGVEKLLPGE